jgi:hypothetical protein
MPALPSPSSLIGNDRAGEDVSQNTEIHRIAALTGSDPMSRQVRSLLIDELRSSFTRPLPVDVTA